MQKTKTPRRGPVRAERHNRRGRGTLSAQQTIPYVRMLPDGICQLPGGLFTKTLAYEDINYSVASTEDQSAIFNGWSAFLNYFDASIPFQLSFVNRRSHSGGRYKINKGYTAADILEQCRKLDEAGIEYYFVYMTGLAGHGNGYRMPLKARSCSANSIPTLSLLTPSHCFLIPSYTQWRSAENLSLPGRKNELKSFVLL